MSNQVQTEASAFDEAHLQSIISWAIPRYIEELNADPNVLAKRWGSYAPASSKQSPANPSGLAFDILAIIGATILLGLELKVCKTKGQRERIFFQHSQLEFLEFVGKVIRTYICFDTGLLSINGSEIKSLEEAARSFFPSAAAAKDLLTRIIALSPSDLKTVAGDQNSRDVASFYNFGDRERNLEQVIASLYEQEEPTSGKEFEVWRSMAVEVNRVYLGPRALPTNLTFIAAAIDSFRPIGMDNFRLALNIITVDDGGLFDTLKTVLRAQRDFPNYCSKLFYTYESGIKALVGIWQAKMPPTGPDHNLRQAMKSDIDKFQRMLGLELVEIQLHTSKANLWTPSDEEENPSGPAPAPP